ncbi:rubrerythrin family protein [Halorussus gelatinilyticus]|uniref:Rubrerythrin family protein n=1 Tax=Halorussus gelatinilyticus TaxID=2937524 RepID=A0A8U0ILN6_9EURY|nr:rubrerythrin family protein [Halorussus gelatinilyticus]UPW02047.1 rubrerythrin family protein [Halorussus gelatinilyticus]
MNADEFLDLVRDDNETALSRLGSSKSLYAETEGKMEPETVFRAAADAEFAASETFRQWADDAAAESVREAFADFADQERDHYEQVVGKLDEDVADHEPSEVPAIHEYLRDLDGDPARVGGFLGRTVASEKSKEQMVGFFVGQADPQTAQLFRDLGDDLDGQLERGTELLADVCESDADWDAALDAASGAIQAAYDEYTETLEGMGVNPKPVC